MKNGSHGQGLYIILLGTQTLGGTMQERLNMMQRRRVAAQVESMVQRLVEGWSFFSSLS